MFMSMACFIGSTPELRGLSIAAYFLLGALPTLRELSNAQLAGQVDHDMRGTALGLNETLFALARSIAALLAGSLFALDPRAPFIASLVLIPIGLVVIVRLQPPVTREEFVVMATASNVILETIEDE
jgi:MFS family permease